MIVVGLTGGIASGKSTACRLLEEEGFPVVDCDQIAYDAVERVLCRMMRACDCTPWTATCRHGFVRLHA